MEADFCAELRAVAKEKRDQTQRLDRNEAGKLRDEDPCLRSGEVSSRDPTRTDRGRGSDRRGRDFHAALLTGGTSTCIAEIPRSEVRAMTGAKPTCTMQPEQVEIRVSPRPEYLYGTHWKGGGGVVQILADGTPSGSVNHLPHVPAAALRFVHAGRSLAQRHPSVHAARRRAVAQAARYPTEGVAAPCYAVANDVVPTRGEKP